MKMNSAAFWAALLLSAGTINAHAGLVANFSDWELAVPGYTSVAIPEPVPNIPHPITNTIIPGAQYFDTGSVSYGGVHFASSGDAAFFNIGPNFELDGVPASNGTQPVLSSQTTNGLANILITLAAPVKAFALNFDTYDGDPLDGITKGAVVTFTLSNGETLTLNSLGNAYDLTGFFGVVDETPFKTILLTTSAPVLSINELNFGAAVSPIPEPATWVMLLLGFVGIGAFGARSATRSAVRDFISLVKLPLRAN